MKKFQVEKENQADGVKIADKLDVWQVTDLSIILVIIKYIVVLETVVKNVHNKENICVLICVCGL